MTSQFESSRLKIKRAYSHIQELESALLAFVETDICSLRVDQDRETGQSSMYVESIKHLPPEMSLIIGDAVHNLRIAQMMREGLYRPVHVKKLRMLLSAWTCRSTDGKADPKIVPPRPRIDGRALAPIPERSASPWATSTMR